MTSSTSRREELFHRALALSETERRAFLERECTDEPELLARIERLLAGHGHAPAGFLPEDSALPAGETIAGFEIVECLGEGGMGVVYAARQAFPRREVAIKVGRPGPVSERAVRRFEHEVQALARLQHPGIARVYTAGTARVGGREQPYLVMELVRGRPLLEHARERGLDRRARIELAARVCDAVHHAHQRGVIHRDLKPENVLVVSEEDDPVGRPKLLDFGIARVEEADERMTLDGELVGTLGYMSPEQLDGEPDVRTDVYAVGVLLYELLTDRPPLDLEGAPFGEAVRRIREVDPPRPSVHVPGLRGDLDTIIARALEKEPERRYQSAATLAADLRRSLAGEAIEARADSAVYVLRKSLRRHRAFAISATAILLAITTVAVVSTIQSRSNRRLSLRLADELELSDVERGRRFSLDDDVQHAESLLWPAFLKNPAERHVAWALWEMHARAPCLGTWPWGSGYVLDLDFHPDGRTLAAGGADGRILVIDTQQPEVRDVRELDAWIWELEFSPDGARLAAACGDGRVRLWTHPGGELVHAFEVQGDAATAASFHPEGILVSGSSSGAIELWDPVTGLRTGALEGGANKVSTLAFDRAGHRLASAGTGERVLVFEELAPAPVLRLEAGSREVLTTAFSPDGALLAWGGKDKSIRVWDFVRGVQLAAIDVANGFTEDLAFHSGEELSLLSAGWRSAQMRRVPGFEVRQQLGIATSELDLSPGQELLVTANTRRLRAWDFSGRGTERLEPHAGRSACELARDGRTLATGDQEGTVRVWSVDTAELLLEHDTGGARVRSLSFQPGGELLAAGNEAGWVSALDTATGDVAFRLEGHNEITAASVAFGPDGRLLAHTLGGGRVRVVDVSTRSVVAEVEADLPLPNQSVEALGVAFHPDGQHFVTTGRSEHHLRVWNLHGELQHEVFVHSPWTPAFSHDGSLLAVSSWFPGVHLVDATCWEVIGQLGEHRAVVWDVQFAPGDPTTLATCSDDGTLKLWDVPTRQRLATLRDHGEWETFAVTLGPDGLLASAGRDGVLLRDLRYFDHHVAANLPYQLETLGADLEGTFDRAGVDAWAAEVNRREWPRYAW